MAWRPTVCAISSRINWRMCSQNSAGSYKKKTGTGGVDIAGTLMVKKKWAIV
jgi:hypothetical protein